MAAWQQLPESRYTGVGSLFHRSPAEAVDFVLQRFPDLPFWPQLPQAGDDMLRQAVEPPTEKLLPGFFELERRAAEIPAGAPWLKCHIAGPETLRKSGFSSSSLPGNARWQVARTLALGKLPVLALDEPAWTDPLPDRAATSSLLADLRAAGAIVGFHSCGKTPWVEALDLRPDFINPDVSAGVKPFVAEFGEALKRHVEAGGWIGWGIVPTTKPPGVARAITREFLAAIAPLGPKEKVLAQSFFTPACGLGLLSPVQAEDVCRVLFEVSRFCRVDHLGLAAR